MEADATDQLTKTLNIDGSSLTGSDLGSSSGLMSPVTLQMQKHLLSSTLQTNSDVFRNRSGRNGSCSPTPALPYTPTPSPSPFNSLTLSMNSSLPDLNLSLSGDAKGLNFLQEPKTRAFPSSSSSFDDLDACLRTRPSSSKYPDMTLNHLPLGSVASTEISPSSRFSPQMELNSVLNFSEQSQVHLPPTSQDNLKGFLVMDTDSGTNASSSLSIISPSEPGLGGSMRLIGVPSTNKSMKIMPVSMTSEITQPVILPKQDNSLRLVSDLQPCLTTLKSVSSGKIACLTELPTVTTQQIACLTNIATPVTTQIACITNLPAPVSSPIACITNLSTPATTQIPCLSASPSLSSIDSLECLPSLSTTRGVLGAGYDSYSSTIVHPNKKRRLLTFLTEDNNVGTICPENKPSTSILVNQNEPSKSDTYILNTSVSSLVPVSSNSPTLILDPTVAINTVPKPEPAIFLNPGGPHLGAHTKNSTPSNIFLSDSQTSINLDKPTNQEGVFLNQRESIGKNEQTLIINSDGTQATLITPVSGQQTNLIGTQSQNGSLLDSVPGSGNLVSGHLVQPNQLLQPNAVISQNYLSKTSYAAGPLLSAPTLGFRPMLNTSFTVESLPDASADMEDLRNVEPVTFQFPVGKQGSPPMSRGETAERLLPSSENFIEKLSVYKCKLCGFLGTTTEFVELHVFDEHENRAVNLKYKDENNWIKVAQREGIKLNCPMCANMFSSERSFNVHLTEDHQVSDQSAAASFERENAERKSRTLKVIREEKERMKMERRRSRQHGYEVYVNNDGELRVRSMLNKHSVDDEQSEEYIDVEGDDRRGNTDAEDFDIKASEYVDMLLKGKTALDSRTEKVSKQKLNTKEKSVRSKVGRPKGSRSLGLSCLKKVDPNLSISDSIMGEECGVDNCAVRLKDRDKLELHRFSHTKDGHQCPECSEQFTLWSKCALHLWRKHENDMELFKCEKCNYRSYTLTVLERHKGSHSDEKPFLCPTCGRALKNTRMLKEHMKTVHKIGTDGNKIETENSLLECDICKKRMSSVREVRYHKERVHKRSKPFLCGECGYAAYSRSSLNLHTRSHTGDKPYACKECKYRTGDHNSFRRHALRHAGQKPYNCPYCTYAAIQSTIYKKHLKKKHPDKSADAFNCGECSFKTIQEKLYKAHLAEHRVQNNNKENQGEILPRSLNPVKPSPSSTTQATGCDNSSSCSDPSQHASAAASKNVFETCEAEPASSTDQSASCPDIHVQASPQTVSPHRQKVVPQQAESSKKLRNIQHFTDSSPT